MKIVEIESANNQKLKLIRGLAQFGKTKDNSLSADLILIEGQKLIQEALDHNIELHDVMVSDSYYKDNFDKTDLVSKLESLAIVKDKLFKDLYTTDTSCGIIATGTIKHHDLSVIIPTAKRLLLGDNIQDPGNLGTIIRTALAFSADGLILSKGCVDCYSPKVIRSSMGAIFSLPVVNKVDLKIVIEQLKKHNFQIVGLDSKAKRTIWQEESQDKPIAYLLGNEGHGISADIEKMVDSTLSIPINPDCESLNVAVAAGIILVNDKLKTKQKDS